MTVPPSSIYKLTPEVPAAPGAQPFPGPRPASPEQPGPPGVRGSDEFEREPAADAGWRKVRLGLLLLSVWFWGLIGYVLLHGLQRALQFQIATGLLAPLQIVPISGYILCVFVPVAGAARNLALANLGVVAVGLAVTILAQHAERRTSDHRPEPAAGPTRPGETDRVLLQMALAYQGQLLLWGIQNALLTAYLHVVARAFEARELADGAARAALLAVGCAALLLATLPVVLLVPPAVVLILVPAAVLSLVSYLWQAILLVQAYRTLTWHLAA
jgi:hypothetical protein